MCETLQPVTETCANAPLPADAALNPDLPSELWYGGGATGSESEGMERSIQKRPNFLDNRDFVWVGAVHACIRCKVHIFHAEHPCRTCTHDLKSIDASETIG